MESRAHLRASTNSCLCGHEAHVMISSVALQLCPLFITLLLIAIWAWYRSSAVLHRFLLGTMMYGVTQPSSASKGFVTSCLPPPGPVGPHTIALYVAVEPVMCSAVIRSSSMSFCMQLTSH